MLSGLMPPPLSTQAVSDCQGPAAPEVMRSVPPTETTKASSAGQASFLRRPGGVVAGCGEEVLALSGHLLEVWVERAGIGRRPAPGAADGGGQRVVGGHGADDGGVAGSDVHDQTGETGSHSDCLGHVECLLGVVAVAAGGGVDAVDAGAVGGDDADGYVVGLADVVEVSGEVGEVGAEELE